MRTKKNNEIRTTKEGIMVGTKTKDHENGANSVAGRTRRSSFPIGQDSFHRSLDNMAHRQVAIRNYTLD